MKKNKMNNKGLVLSMFFVALFVVGMLGASYVMLIGDLNAKFNGLNESVINTTLAYNSIGELNSNVEIMRNQTESNSNSILDVLGFFTKGGYSMLTLTFNSFHIMTKMINTIAGVMHIKEVFVKAIGGIIMVLILFAIASAIFKINI